MTMVSLADACRRLSIDAKTLRRWVADAQLSLHPLPGDGRKKGLSGEHLQQLARLHHRQFDTRVEEPLSALHPSLPAELLALPETIDALHAQICALQASVATLTSLLHQHLPPPASSPPSPSPSKPAKRGPKPPSPVPTKAPAKPAHVIPRVEYATEGRYVVICPKYGALPFEPDTPAWFAWVAKQSSFRFVGKEGHYTAHHEWLVPNGAWRAHRQIRNHSYNVRLAPNQGLTIAVLEQAAQTLHAYLV